MTASGKHQILGQGKHLRLVARDGWEYAERSIASGAVVIVAITAEQKLLLVEQDRLPVNGRVLELPAGLVGDIPGDEQEQWLDAARRELLEETGYSARSAKLLTQGPISAGFGNEMITFVRATGLKKVSAGGGVEHEQIVIHEVPLDRVPAWLKRQQKRGLLIDPKIYAGLYFV